MIQLEILLDGSSTPSVFPFNLVSGFRWLVSKPYSEGISLTKKFSIEKDSKCKDLGKEWNPISWPENALEIEPIFQNQPGVLYLRHFIYSPTKRRVRIGVPTNQQMRLWINGHRFLDTRHQVPLRPNYGGDGANYITTVLKAGWNHIMVKFCRTQLPIEAHFVISFNDDKRGMDDIIEGRFPWETQ